MFKTKTFDEKSKKPNLSGYVRKKTFDYRNIINFDEDISEMDINIKEIPTFKKNLLILIVQRIQERLII
jgi:hypothetical protein